MPRRLITPGILVGVMLSVLWILAGGLYRLLASDVYITRLMSFIGVGPLQAQSWSLPGLWAPAALLLSAGVLTSVCWFIVGRDTRGRSAFLVMWLAAILATAVLGLSFDVMRALAFLPDFGLRGLTAAVIETAPDAVYWGVLNGWIPALIVSRIRRTQAGPRGALVPVIAVVVSVLLFIVAVFFGREAEQQQIIQDNAEQQGLTEDDGAYPDPEAPGDPVPEVAPGESEPDLGPDGCTSDRATLLLGGSDAATGHRMQVIHLMNFSDAPCVIEGYPDIAFADQNGNELEVSVVPGSSFMAADPGATPITVPAQGQASTTISWDANATAGALVARQLYAAPIAGLARGAWPVELDVVAGAELNIAAWQLDSTGGGAP